MNSGVRYGRIDDLEFITGLERGCLALPWPVEAVRELLLYDPMNDSQVFKFALVKEGAGYVSVSGVIDEAEIGNIVVAPECRGRGYGRLLLEELENILAGRGIRKIFLEVESTNQRALSLYRSCGFAEYGVRNGYYGEGRDALLMSKEPAPLLGREQSGN